MIRKDRKIAVLGTGNVGATIAYALTLQGVCSEIVLVDINKESSLFSASFFKCLQISLDIIFCLIYNRINKISFGGVI